MNKAGVELVVSVVRGVAVSGGFVLGYQALSKSSEDSNFLERFYQRQAAKIGVKLPQATHNVANDREY